MKNKTKKLFFTYIGVSVLAIITPITIVCGTNCHTTKIANSRQINTTINRVQKVPNFVNASLYQNTNYGTTTITINQATGLVNGGNNSYWQTMSNGGDYINSAINSFISNLNNNANTAMSSFEHSNSIAHHIPQNIDWASSTLTNNTNISGGLNITVASYCSSCASPNVQTTGPYSFYFNKNSLTYSANNFTKAFWYKWPGTNYAPLQVNGKMSFTGFSVSGIPQFNLTGNESICWSPTNWWPHDCIYDASVKFSSASN
ncbi:MAG: hypothetical protein IIT81_01000, partial [Mycoplasmataceae bacterium]|nr:hypothetical protein [Mycoplasmataceae bacterium]